MLAGLALVAIMGGGWIAFGIPRDPGPSPSPSPSATPAVTSRPTATPSPRATPTPTPAPVAVCPWNGLPLDDAALLERTSLIVQIENHPGARPARNLTRADFVVEATVEGDTTRFSAVFLCRPTEGLTGPVRSARYYTIDLWQDLGVLPVGFGASNGSLSRFAAAGMPYVNGITGRWPWFRRAGTYAAPHNLYGDVEAIRSALGQNAALDELASKVAQRRPPFTFDDDARLPDGRQIASVEIRTNAYWRIGWRWEPELSAWRRMDAGADIGDAATGEPVTAKSVIVQRVTEEVVYGDPDPGGNSRRLHHLVGSGNGTLYVDGRAIDLKWSRPTPQDGTTWTYVAGGERVVLPPGVVWWEIVPVGAGLTES